MRRIALLFMSLLCLLAVQASDREIKIAYGKGVISLVPLSDNSVRVRYSEGNIKPLKELFYIRQDEAPSFKTVRNKQGVVVRMKSMMVVYNKKGENLMFLDSKGRTVLKEVPGGRRVLTTNVRADGTATVPALDVTQRFASPADEHIFGTGQFQDGYLDVRGLTRRLTQVNTQIAIPFILSSKGFGLLWNNYGLTDYNPADNELPLTPKGEVGKAYEVAATSDHGGIKEHRLDNAFCTSLNVKKNGRYSILLNMGQRMSRKQYLAIDDSVVINQNSIWLPPTTSVIVSLRAGQHKIEVRGVKEDKPVIYWRLVDNTTTFHSPVAQAIDYTVFVGNADEVIASYRHATGRSPLMPSWMLGYVHCRERYHTQEQLLSDAHRFRHENIPVDVIVQDWQYWGRTGWNSMEFDKNNYPDPAAMVGDLHRNNIRLMISVWSKTDRNSNLGKRILSKGYYVPDTDWWDFFNPKAASYYWQCFRDSLVRPYHIDAWWLDATEPENDDLTGRRIAAGTLPGDLYRNVYPTMVVGTVYNGLAKEQSDRAPVILTRSACPGMQRYNALTWSGDVGWDMETLRRQINAGLNYVSCGLPWWTYDAGGFFRPSDQYTNAKYEESMLRWIENAVFLPVMRVHGYQSDTEPWNYDDETKKIFVRCIKEREALKPYFESLASRVAEEDYTLMRPLIFDFADDEEALKQELEYMCGPKYLVCPVVKLGVTSSCVYLPKNKKGWTDHYSGRHYDGGQYVTVVVSKEHIPVFERK